MALFCGVIFAVGPCLGICLSLSFQCSYVAFCFAAPEGFGTHPSQQQERALARRLRMESQTDQISETVEKQPLELGIALASRVAISGLTPLSGFL